MLLFKETGDSLPFLPKDPFSLRRNVWKSVSIWRRCEGDWHYTAPIAMAVRTRRRFKASITALSLILVFAAACAPKPVTYRLPQLANLPAGATSVADARVQYDGDFCGVLAHLTGWEACARYLHPPHAMTPTPSDSTDAFLRGYPRAECTEVTLATSSISTG